MIKFNFSKLKKLNEILLMNVGEFADVMGYISKKGEVSLVK